MASTVVALYDNFSSANSAVRELLDNGFQRSDISLVASDPGEEYGQYLANTDMQTSSAAEGAGVGAGIGAVIGGLGGLLVGLGALAIPGIGPVVAAGPLAAALSALAGAGAGAVAGGVTGGLLGALMDLGVPRDTAEYYAEGVRRGGHLVTLNVQEEMSSRAVDILNRHGPVDVNERATQWRQTGWTGYDPNAEPYRPSQSTAETARDWPDTTMGTAGSGVSTEWPHSSDEIAAGSAAGMEAGTTTSYPDFSYYDTNFRSHFENSSFAHDYSYDQFRPAYRYGYDLARDESYRGRSWDAIEMDARQQWDERNPGTWDRFKQTVRYAWEEIKDVVS